MPDQDSSTRFRAPIIELFSPMMISARTTSRTTMTMMAISIARAAYIPGARRRRNLLLAGVLVLEQETLQLGPAAVVADIPARANDPVAWNDDRNRVGPERRPRGPERSGAPG